MTRDLNLWRLILRQVRDEVEPAELANYSTPLITYNAALLVNSGFVEGDVIQDGNGDYASVKLLHLTNRGHDLLESLERDAKTSKPTLPMPSPHTLSIFISHSAKDEEVAAALIELLRNALNVPSDKIRCTSVDGYRLPVGAHTEERLRQEVHDAQAFIGLITPSSIASAYVMFELGARWGARLHLAPLLAAGASADSLRGPLSSLNALRCEEAAQLHQLITDLAKVLQIQHQVNPAAYQKSIDELIRVCKSAKPDVPAATIAEPPPINPPLDPLEIRILKMFTGVRERSLGQEFILTALNVHPLKGDQLLDRLTKRELLYRGTRIGFPASFRLTAKGRDYITENNLI